MFFFLKGEGGLRFLPVTGVKTCPLRLPRRAAVAGPAAARRDGDPHRRSVGLCLADLRPAGKRAGGHLSALEIAPVTGGASLQRFTAFPDALSRGGPLLGAQLRVVVRTLLVPPHDAVFRVAQ